MSSGAITVGRHERSAWYALGRSVVRFDRSKLVPWIALRNSIGFGLPLVAGIATGSMGAGIAVATGALNVSYSDSSDPYLLRARRMTAASVLVGLAVACGSLCGGRDVLGVAVAGAWAFAAGMLVALGSTAADLGVISLVTLIVYEATPRPAEVAIYAGLLALGGGLLQTLITTAMWPFRKYGPERRILGQLFTELARASSSPLPATEAPPASVETSQAQVALGATDRDSSVEAERFRSLLNQAERLRLSILALRRMRARLRREQSANGPVELLNSYFDTASNLLGDIGRSLRPDATPPRAAEHLRRLQELAESMRAFCRAGSSQAEATTEDARRQMDAMTGQIRSAVDLAAHSTPAGLEAFDRREITKPWTLRLAGTLATLSANLNLHSAAFRHAIRLAVCVAAGDALGRSLGFQRSYWLPMTIAIVLKPDFTATFSRGVLRLAGTFAGLLFATGLFHLLPSASGFDVACIVGLMFALRWLGAANYGVFVAFVTALIVFLIALAGVNPKVVMVARGWNSAVGGVISLAAYWLWPTWERARVPEAIARLLDSYREYFRAVRLGYEQQLTTPGADINRVRIGSRLARSNAEASVDRMTAEPGVTAQRVSAASGVLASSHRLVHALMSLEAGLATSPVPARQAFGVFANDIEKTLYYLAAALRGSPLGREDLPDIREDHYALVRSGDSLMERYALVNVETDRITNSLNTLSEQVLRWIEAGGLNA